MKLLWSKEEIQTRLPVLSVLFAIGFVIVKAVRQENKATHIVCKDWGLFVRCFYWHMTWLCTRKTNSYLPKCCKQISQFNAFTKYKTNIKSWISIHSIVICIYLLCNYINNYMIYFILFLFRKISRKIKTYVEVKVTCIMLKMTI